MKKSSKLFCVGICSGLLFCVFLYLILQCEGNGPEVSALGLLMLITIATSMLCILQGRVELMNENPEKYKPTPPLRQRTHHITHDTAPNVSSNKGSSTIWMWLIGLPLLTLAKLIAREPGSKKRRSKW